MAFIRHRQRVVTALSPHDGSGAAVLPARGLIPGLERTGTTLKDTTANFTPIGINSDGTRMYWVEANNSDMRQSLSSTAGFPYVNPVTAFDGDTVSFPAGRSTSGAQTMRDTHISHDGSLLAVCTSDLGYGYILKSTDDNPANFSTTPVLHCGSRASDGLGGATNQCLGARGLGGTQSFANGTVNGAPATVFAEYTDSTADDNERTMWYTTDGGATWAKLWKSSTAAGTLHRAHVHSCMFLPGGGLLVMCGDAAAEAAIIWGPATTAFWGSLDDLSNTAIDAVSGAKILYGSEEYRVIEGAVKGGYLYYGLDSGSQFGVYRLSLSAEPDEGDDHEKVYDGLNGRLTTDKVRSSTTILTQRGTIMVVDWLEGGAVDPSSSDELRIMSSINGAVWADTGNILLDTAKTPGYFNAVDVFQLPTGEIIFGHANYRRDLRDDPSGSVTPAEVAIAFERGYHPPGQSPTVLAPEVQA